MALNLSTAFLNAMAQEVEVTLLVTIDAGGTSHRYVFAPHAIEGALDLVTDVTGMSSKLDPVTRRTSAGELSVTFSDEGTGGEIRKLVRDALLYSKRISVKIGARGLALSDYAPYFDGLIDDIVPSEGEVTFKCIDFFSVLKTRLITAEATRQHPLQIIYALGFWNETVPGILRDGGVPPDRIDGPSFHPDRTATGTYPMSHFNTTRGTHGTNDRYEDDVDVFLMLQEINQLLGGCIFVTEEGRIKFTPYDPAALLVDTWTSDDVDDIKQKNAYGDIYNRVAVDFGWKGEGQGATEDDRRQMGTDSRAGESDASWLYRHTLVDPASLVKWAAAGETARVLDLKFESKWIGVESFLMVKQIITGYVTKETGSLGQQGTEYQVPVYEDAPFSIELSDGPGATYTLEGGWVDSFCGVRRINDGEVDGALHSTLADGRTAYHMVILEDGSAEIIEVDGVAIPGTAVGTGNNLNAPARVTFRIKRRRVNLGDNEIYAFTPGSRVVDVTIAVLMAKRNAERWADGGPELTCTTDLSKHRCQLGDLVTLPNDVALWHGRDGATETDRWEIISKEIDPVSDVPRIKWGLKHVRIPPLAAEPAPDTFDGGAHGPVDDGRGLDDLLDDHFGPDSYTTVFDSAVNRIRVAPGVAVVKGIRRATIDAVDITFPPGGEDFPQPGEDLVAYPGGVDGHVVYDGFSHAFMLVASARGAELSLGSYQQIVGTATMGSSASAATASYVDKRATKARLIDPEIKDTTPGALPTTGRTLTNVGGEIRALDASGVEGGHIRGAALKPGSGVTTSLDSQGRLVDPVIKDADPNPLSDLRLAVRRRQFSVLDSNNVERGAAFVGGVAGLKPNSDGMPYAVVIDRDTTNYLVNPSFENNVTDGWSPISDLTLAQLSASGDFIFGAKACRVTVNASPLGQKLQSAPRVAAVVGEVWSASVWIRLRTAAKSVNVSVEGTDNAGAQTEAGTSQIAYASGAWVLVTAKLTVAVATTTYVNVLFSFPIGSLEQSFDIDAVQLEKGIPSSYCDGSLGAGYSWAGAEHASASARVGGFRALGAMAAGAPPIVIWDDGTISLGIQSHFRAYRGLSAQTGFTGAAYTRCVFEVEHWDDAREYSTTTGIWTCREAGAYLFTGSVYLSDLASGELVVIVLRQNGADRSAHYGEAGVAAAARGGAVCAILDCAVGDTVDVNGFHSGATGTVNMAANAGNHFAGRRIG